MKTSLIFVRVVIYFLAISALSLIGCAETAKNVDNAEEKNTANLYPDSLTPIQRSCVEKAFKSEKDSNCKGVCVWDVEGYMTEEEKDAIVELSIWDYKKKYKPIDESNFNRRFKEVFGYDFNSFLNIVDLESPTPIGGKKYSDNLIGIFLTDPYEMFYISQKEKIILDGFNFGIKFTTYNEINSFIPASIDLEHLFHLNNYLFNDANVSRTWLLNNDKYFMAHLLLDFGYDGDKEINKMVLKKNQEEDSETIDAPLYAFNIYPDGKLKILDGILKTAVDISTADCAEYFKWATSIVDLFGKTNFDSNGSYIKDDFCPKIKNLTLSQRREIVAHVVNYMQPVYEKFIGSGMNYGNPNSDFGDQLIIGCFWNYMMNDHEVIADFEKNNYYGLPNLESLISSMKNFKPFYNEESGEFEPWEYIPMRYRQPDKEEE